VREGGKVVKVRLITSLKPEAQAFIDTLKGDEDGTESLVDD
jgi:hypothetical protein